MERHLKEYEALKVALREMSDKYSSGLGVNLAFSSDGNVYIYDENWNKKRRITPDECELLLNKYKQLEDLIEKLTHEVSITF